MLKFVGLTSLFVVALVTLTLALTWLAYRMTWRGHQRWMEATRHQRKLAMAVGRWIWFKWAHIDCEYWVVHVDFRAGPIELRGATAGGLVLELYLQHVERSKPFDQHRKCEPGR